LVARKPTLLLEIPPPSIMGYLTGSEEDLRGIDAFLREVEASCPFVDMLHISDALHNPPCLSSVGSLALLRHRANINVAVLCSLRVQDLNFDVILQKMGEAVALGSKHVLIEGDLHRAANSASVNQDTINPINVLRELRQIGFKPPLINLGLQSYVDDAEKLREVSQAEPDFTILRLRHYLDVPKLSNSLPQSDAPVFIRIPVPELTGLGLYSNKVIENIVITIASLDQYQGVIVASPHGFEEGLDVVKRLGD